MANMLNRKQNLKPATPTKKTREDYAQDALYREVWEDVNNEKTIAFFKKYYKQLIGGALALLIVVAGYQIGVRTYRAHQMAMAVNYETALENTDVNALASIGERGRGANADLALFQSYVLDKNKDITKLEKLAEHGNTRDFRDLARLHVVGARGDSMTAADVEKYLSPLNTKSSPFYYTAMLTIAQKYLAAGDNDNANKWLDKIMNDPDCPGEISGTAQTLK
ncbi:MAG: hypothetical protein IKP24_01165 [Alphaproteobacteria bacterium]|nr:hypothetical protein [Alphaproteobacteria bacterium]